MSEDSVDEPAVEAAVNVLGVVLGTATGFDGSDEFVLFEGFQALTPESPFADLNGMVLNIDFATGILKGYSADIEVHEPLVVLTNRELFSRLKAQLEMNEAAAASAVLHEIQVEADRRRREEVEEIYSELSDGEGDEDSEGEA